MADLLDTNVVVRCALEYYRFTVFPGVWDWFESALERGALVLIPAVHEELAAWGEPIPGWIRESTIASVPDISQDIAEVRISIAESIESMSLHPDSVSLFMTGADIDLVSYALAGGHRVITLETKENPGKSSKRAKIPDICEQLGVKHLNPFQMLDDHGARFELRR